jgi:hypothetical protein
MGCLFVLTLPLELTDFVEHQTDIGLAESPEDYIIRLVREDFNLACRARAVLEERCGGKVEPGAPPETSS